MKRFRDTAREALRHSELRRALDHNTRVSVEKRRRRIAQTPGYAEASRRAARARRRMLREHRTLLQQWIQRARSRGIQVHPVASAGEARRAVLRILERHGVRRVVKSKSMITEEIGLNPALEAAGIQVTETDLGEWIVQLLGQRPSHITAPALHLRRHEIRHLFHEKLGYSGSEDPRELAAFARWYLRQRFLEAEAGITGANFLVAETGGLVILENEGNAGFTLYWPRLHVAVASVEKVVADHRDLADLLRVLPVAATGQRQTAYVRFVQGPISKDREVHVVLLHGPRLDWLQDPDWAETFACIRCGACSTECPVYQTVGGHAYASVYSGPIGIPLSFLLWPDEVLPDLAYACTLCGRCVEVCPVEVPLVDLILRVRQRTASRALSPLLKGWLRGWTLMMTSPPVQAMARRLLRSPLARPLSSFGPFRAWTRERGLSFFEGEEP